MPTNRKGENAWGNKGNQGNAGKAIFPPIAHISTIPHFASILQAGKNMGSTVKTKGIYLFDELSQAVVVSPSEHP